MGGRDSKTKGGLRAEAAGYGGPSRDSRQEIGEWIGVANPEAKWLIETFTRNGLLEAQTKKVSYILPHNRHG